MVDPQEFGEMKGEFSALKTKVHQMDEKVDRILTFQENQKGAQRALVLIGGSLAGFVGTAFAKYLPWVGK